MKESTISKNFNYEGIDYTYFGGEDTHQWKQTPWYEHQFLLYLKNLNLEGVYVDAGTNLGNHSLFFVNHCPSTMVYSFEPTPWSYNTTSKNLAVNAKKDYSLHNTALWEEKTTLSFSSFTDYSNTGHSLVSPEGNIKVEADTLDNMIPETDKVVYIKIDVEGSEPQVIKGGMNLIQKHRPLISCEAATAEEFKRINDTLLPLGYIHPTRKFNATPSYFWFPGS